MNTSHMLLQHLHYQPRHAIASWVFTVKTNIEKAIKIPYKSNIQGNNIMEKSFTHCTVDVMSLVRSNRSGFHYFIAPTQNLSRMVASSCYIHSRSTTRSLRPCSTNVSSLYCQKSSFFLVSCLLRPLSIKVISQSSIPQCPSNIK